MTQQNAIVLAPDRAIEGVQLLANLVNTLYSKVMREGTDYGVIPGTNDKPTLFLPGMEKLMRALNVTPQYILIHVIRDYDKPLFHYEYECTLVDAETGFPVPGGRAIGLATSAEAKWGWRWVTLHRVPPNLDPSKLVMRGGKAFEFQFAIEKAETTGKYGKPADYWQTFRDAIANNEAFFVEKETKRGMSPGYEIDMTEYRIPNDAVYDQINTICKIAQKRALASAIKGATNSSELFNIDLEDLVDHVVSRRAAPVTVIQDFVEGEAVEISQPSASVRGAGVQKPLTAWADDPAQLDAFYASALEKFSFTKVTVTETLDALDSLEFADWRTSRGWALAALVAEYCNNDVVKIDEYTSGMGGNEEQALTLRDRARQIAVTNAQNVGVLL